MSEELQAKHYTKNGQIIGSYEYLNIGATTLSQLLKANYIPSKDYKEYSTRKPDGLLIQRGNKKNPIVMAVIEDKPLGTFVNPKDRIAAIQQCNDVCQEVNARIGIITDSNEYIWINPQHNSSENDYLDLTTKKLRSYSFITFPSGEQLLQEFYIDQKGDESNPEVLSQKTKDTYNLIEEVVAKISDNSSVLNEGKKIDPLPLARRVWQDIWIATGKTPEKCLYNVVELFIFKFLSDLGILQSPYDFNTLFELYKKNPTKIGSENVLKYYTNNSRKEIIRLFPHSNSDNTTIINGTIFVDERGDANLSTSILFVNSLKKFKDFELEFGKFTNIDKDFKTKLYETFLKQTAGLKSLGQFFTPRKVIQAIIQVSDIDKLTHGQRYCDPFCGVGGFVLEPLNIYKELFNEFIPKNGQIKPSITYLGYDKGFEKDEERTIILAKANMLIYLAEIISKNRNLTTEFSNVFNSTFNLWKTNLATLEQIPHSENDLFDLIITNPPYVTKGEKTLLNEIEHEAELKNFYSINATGVEGLCLEWIIKNLKNNGKAFVIIPDGILSRENDTKLRKFLLDECYLDAIISLPLRTFFSTSKKTYIIGITKKQKNVPQTNPVFTYLVSNIGETLDVNRFEIEENDLKEMVSMFNQFKGIKSDTNVKNLLESQSKRCKIQDIGVFNPSENWKIDKWWTHDEKVELGIEEEEQVVNINDFFDNINSSVAELSDISKKNHITFDDDVPCKEVTIGDIFDFPETNSKITKAFCIDHTGDIPVYASSKDEASTLGYIKDGLKGIKYYQDCLSWNRNGSVGYVFIRNHRFATNEDHRAMVIKKEFETLLNKEFLKYEIEKNLFLNGFSFLEKCGLSKIQKVSIKIPVNKENIFDIKQQAEIASKYKKIDELKDEFKEKLDLIINSKVAFYL